MIPWYTASIPYITTQQMIEVDRAMIEDYGIQLIQMMENAGRGLAQVARECFLQSPINTKRVVVFAGTGGNGGGALVAARHLHNYGAQVTIYTTKPEEQFTEIPRHQLKICKKLGIPIHCNSLPEASQAANLLIDGIIGYSLKGAPRGRAADMINWINQQSTPTLSLDTPSGIDSTTGEIYLPAVEASATMTLALPKSGFLEPKAKKYLGDLYLADISVPPELYVIPSLGLKVTNIFAECHILRLM